MLKRAFFILAFIIIASCAVFLWQQLSSNKQQTHSPTHSIDKNAADDSTQPISKVIVIRHGQSENNVKGVSSSNPEHPKYIPSHLTEKGHEQVINSAEKLKKQGFNKNNIASIYTSPLPRTWETALDIAHILELENEQIKTDSRLTEVDWGDREGERHDKYQEKDPWFPVDPKSFNGETPESIEKRMMSFYHEIKNSSEKNIIIVTHGLPAYLLIKNISNNIVRLKQAEFDIYVR